MPRDAGRVPHDGFAWPAHHQTFYDSGPEREAGGKEANGVNGLSFSRRGIYSNQEAVSFEGVRVLV